FADYVGLDANGSLDEFLLERISGPGRRGRVRLDEIEDRGVGDEPALDHLGESGTVVVRRQRVEGREVADDAGRWVESADEVLAPIGVDPGLAADRGV